jgi:hypothetical protein
METYIRIIILKKKKRVRRYLRYCTKHIIIIIRGLAAFIEPD